MKKQLQQGYSHNDNLQELYRMIRYTWREEFTEDNLATQEACLREAFEATQVTAS